MSRVYASFVITSSTHTGSNPSGIVVTYVIHQQTGGYGTPPLFIDDAMGQLLAVGLPVASPTITWPKVQKAVFPAGCAVLQNRVIGFRTLGKVSHKVWIAVSLPACVVSPAPAATHGQQSTLGN